LPRTIVKRVYFPIRSARQTSTTITVPLLYLRARPLKPMTALLPTVPAACRTRHRRDDRLFLLQAGLTVTRTSAPRGARTVSSLMRAPLEVSVPEIRTSGNGLSSVGAGGVDVTGGVTGSVTGGVGSGLGGSGAGACGAVSTVNARVRLVWLPALSVARTRKTYAPSASGATAASVVALAQGPYAGVPWSIEHSTVAPASAEKPNSGVLSLVVPDGPKPIDSDGGVVSTVNVREAIAWFPTPLVARTRKTYVPSGSGVPMTCVVALVHGPYAGVPSSTEHSTVVPTSAVNPNDGTASFVGPAGPESIDNDGAALSTEKACEALAWFPTPSVARTRKTYDPSANGATGACEAVLLHGPYAGVP
jgi:hypothetical protein